MEKFEAAVKARDADHARTFHHGTSKRIQIRGGDLHTSPEFVSLSFLYIINLFPVLIILLLGLRNSDPYKGHLNY